MIASKRGGQQFCRHRPASGRGRDNALLPAHGARHAFAGRNGPLTLEDGDRPAILHLDPLRYRTVAAPFLPQPRRRAADAPALRQRQRIDGLLDGDRPQCSGDIPVEFVMVVEKADHVAHSGSAARRYAAPWSWFSTDRACRRARDRRHGRSTSSVDSALPSRFTAMISGGSATLRPLARRKT